MANSSTRPGGFGRAEQFDGRVGGGERQSVVCDGAKEENAP
jgi:hypothetical protein